MSEYGTSIHGENPNSAVEKKGEQGSSHAAQFTGDEGDDNRREGKEEAASDDKLEINAFVGCVRRDVGYHLEKRCEEQLVGVCREVLEVILDAVHDAMNERSRVPIGKEPRSIGDDQLRDEQRGSEAPGKGDELRLDTLCETAHALRVAGKAQEQPSRQA